MTALPLARERGGAPAPARALAVRRLELRDFRNYRHLVLEPGPGPIVLHGENGAGKTNLLEAVSMLAPGRIRSASCCCAAMIRAYSRATSSIERMDSSTM